MSLSVEKQVARYMRKHPPTAMLSEIVEAFEVPRTPEFVMEVIDEMVAVGEYSMTDITSPAGDSLEGFEGVVIEWLKAPEEIVPAEYLEQYQVPPTIPLLIEHSAWTSDDGPKPGIYLNRPPPNTCSYSCTYTLPGFERVEELIGPKPLTQTQVYYFGRDILALNLPHAGVRELGMLMAEPRNWTPAHEEAVRLKIQELHPALPSYLPHWLLRKGHGDMQGFYILPMRVYGTPSFRRSWVPYEVSHAWGQPR